MPYYGLRTCDSDMTSYGGFKWKKRGKVVAPDWEPTTDCGNGLYAFLNGQGSGFLADWSNDAYWLVVEFDDYVDLGGKVKFPECRVLFASQDRHEAIVYLKKKVATDAVIGDTVSAGYRGTAIAGYKGTATAGYRGTATAGDQGKATAGHYGTATAGLYGTATAGDKGKATAGGYGTVTAGYRGTVTAGYHGIINILYCDSVYRERIKTGYIGEDGLKPNTPYKLDSNFNFVEVTTEGTD